MRRRLSHRGSSKRRKFEWSGSYFDGPGAPVSVVSGLAHYVNADWIRVPSGMFDTQLNDLVPNDRTLVRLLPSATISMNWPAMSTYNTAYVGMGVIAWDGTSQNIPLLTEIPYPSAGFEDFEWVWRWTVPVQFITGQTWQPTAAQNQFGPGMQVDVRSQRKLPEGTGLLWVMDVFSDVHTSVFSFTYGFSCRYGMKLP